MEHDPAILQEQDLVQHLLHVGDEVGGDDDRGVLVVVADDGAQDVVAGGGIDAADGLVQEEESCIAAHGEDELELFLGALITQSYIRDTIGLYGVDSVITTGKSEIQASIKSKIADRIEKEDLGIALVNITMQDAEPPTTEVQNAFKAVETAKQGAETATNNADKYKNQVIPGAQATADEAVQKAEAYKQAKINEANAQAQRFNDLYTEYARYPEITRQRLFFETMGDILPDIRVIIKSQGDDIHTYMPVDILGGTQTVTGEEAAQ